MSQLYARRARLIAVLGALCVVLAFALGATPRALAQKVDRQKQAGQFFARGVEQFEKEAYEEALKAFEQAYRLAPHHAVRVNMAACFAKLGRPVEALFNYERFLRESEGKAPPAQKRQVQEAMAELEGQVGELQMQISPSNARVQIDGRPPRPMPDGRVLLAAGSYEVEVFAPGYTSQRTTLQVTGGEPASLKVDLQLATGGTQPTPPPTSTASPDGSSSPWSGFEAAPSYADQPTWAKEKTRRWIASTGLALLTGSIVSGALIAKYNNDRDAALERAQDPNAGAAGQVDGLLDAQQAEERADTARATTLVMLGAGLALETSALVLWLLARKRGADADSARITPVLAPGYAGVSLSGSL